MRKYFIILLFICFTHAIEYEDTSVAIEDLMLETPIKATLASCASSLARHIVTALFLCVINFSFV